MPATIASDTTTRLGDCGHRTWRQFPGDWDECDCIATGEHIVAGPWSHRRIPQYAARLYRTIRVAGGTNRTGNHGGGRPNLWSLRDLPEVRALIVARNPHAAQYLGI